MSLDNLILLQPQQLGHSVHACSRGALLQASEMLGIRLPATCCALKAVGVVHHVHMQPPQVQPYKKALYCGTCPVPPGSSFAHPF